ncbi:hypothetical protein NDU88_000210 [Pleurodeles waltl]|uniref:Uncharacterized protein n=1 Tax=Pleurodeles waltl TaxID=8319 RepID=A0AAV7S6B4_PLEWA|nr:hypothetical protein NDU88_000210 [Pleurodeles waltl]
MTIFGHHCCRREELWTKQDSCLRISTPWRGDSQHSGHCPSPAALLILLSCRGPGHVCHLICGTADRDLHEPVTTTAGAAGCVNPLIAQPITEEITPRLHPTSSAHKPVMPGSRSSNKHLGKPARQLLFLEALRQTRAPTPAPQEHPINQSRAMADASQGAIMDRILQEISAVGRRLEGMVSMMISLTEDTKSVLLDIAGLQSRVTTLEQRVATVETQAALASDRDQELLYLRSKVIDLEDRSRRDNVRFLGFPEEIIGV